MNKGIKYYKREKTPNGFTKWEEIENLPSDIFCVNANNNWMQAMTIDGKGFLYTNKDSIIQYYKSYI
ncbi:hypothetical protein D0T66_06910 [Dysgonomonas sp. 25]|nr:hypothetical protein [Dysgonomonas sp. 25]